MKYFLVVAVVAVSAVTASSAAATSASNWYWTSGGCKSELHNRGVQFDDGRTFNVEQAYCVGYHNHCWLSDGVRRYKVLDTVVRSYDGVVREFTLTVTGRKSWRGSPGRMIERYMSSGRFAAAYGSAAWSVAAGETRAGCWDGHP